MQVRVHALNAPNGRGGVYWTDGVLSGDAHMIDMAKAQVPTIGDHPEDSAVPVDWNDPGLAMAALEVAGEILYGQPVIRSAPPDLYDR